jgi:flagellar M-ring protein FliF
MKGFMGDFFKQLLAQVSDVWQKLSMQQRVIITALTILMFVGLLWLAVWNGAAGGGVGGAPSGFRQLHSGLAVEDAAAIVDGLEAAGFRYRLTNNGTAILVEERNFYEARMALARQGVPSRQTGAGWEILDNRRFGDTDCELRLRSRRALEGELMRTIRSISEIEDVRLHLTIPETSLFLEERQPAKAAVAIRIRAGRTLNRSQIDGIAFLVASSVDGLAINNISIVDFEGRLLSRPVDENDPGMMGGRNMEMRQNVERSLKTRLEAMFANVLGHGRASVEVTADLDFNRVESTLERFDPESRVVRSEERIDMSVRNAPDGDRMNEVQRSNFEIDRTVERILHEVGTIRRLSVAVMVDNARRNGESTPRTVEEMANFETMVRNAIGFDLTRGDQVAVINVPFDNDMWALFEEQTALTQQEEFWRRIINYVALALIVIVVFVMLRSIAKSLGEAMNPPIPEVEIPNLEDVEEEIMNIPPHVARSNELLEKVEIMTENDPQNVAKIIKDWLNEPVLGKKD